MDEPGKSWTTFAAPAGMAELAFLLLARAVRLTLRCGTGADDPVRRAAFMAPAGDETASGESAGAAPASPAW